MSAALFAAAPSTAVTGVGDLGDTTDATTTTTGVAATDAVDAVDAAATDPTLDLPCRTVAEDLWFSETPAELEQAKAHCAGCPLRRECLEGALERREYCGVWGGEIFDRGAVIPRKRPRGRPSKAALARDAEIAAARVAAGVA